MKILQTLLKFLTLAAFLMIGSCSPFIPYETYLLSQDNRLGVEFERPSNWEWEESVGVINSRNEDHNANINIFVSNDDSVLATKDYMKKMIQGRLDFGMDRGATILYEPIVIDGYPALRIVMELPPEVGETEKWNQENIILFVNDRFFWFLLNIDKDQRNSAFGRGFDHIIKTIKVIEKTPMPATTP